MLGHKEEPAQTAISNKKTQKVFLPCLLFYQSNNETIFKDLCVHNT